MTQARAYAEVIGDPIDHSKSPRIHGFWIAEAGIEADYRATRVTRAELPDFLARRRADPHWRGCNVTMPLKLDALMLADEATDRATTAGAANLLAPRDGLLMAANTDVGAVAALLAPIVKDAPPGITLLGNGGAARAILVALRLLGAAGVRIQARDLTAATKLAVEFGLDEGPVAFDQPIVTGGLINSTPLGMKGHPPVALDIDGMPDDGWVFDVVTDPVETELLRRARLRGLNTLDGIHMLVEQAATSFELFFGQPPPRERDAELLETLR